MAQAIISTGKVGVAPGTTTLTFDEARALGTQQCLPVPTRKDVRVAAEQARRQKRPPGVTQERRFYVPYATPSELRHYRGSGGLGLINETDWWRTGNPYGLPGTAALRLTKRPDGRWQAGLVGAGLGQDTESATLLKQAMDAQHRMATGMMILGISTAVIAGVTTLGAVGAFQLFKRRNER